MKRFIRTTSTVKSLLISRRESTRRFHCLFIIRYSRKVQNFCINLLTSLPFTKLKVKLRYRSEKSFEYCGETNQQFHPLSVIMIRPSVKEVCKLVWQFSHLDYTDYTGVC